MILPVHEHSSVTEDLYRAYRWYAKRSKFAAEQFLAQVELTLARVQKNPLQFAIRYGKTIRVAKVKKYPYLLIYEIHPTHLFLYAVTHGKRKNRRWLRRLPDRNGVH